MNRTDIVLPNGVYWGFYPKLLCMRVSKPSGSSLSGPVCVSYGNTRLLLVPPGVQLSHGKQSSWVLKGLTVSGTVEGALMRVEIKMWLCAAVCVCAVLLVLVVYGSVTVCGCQLLFFSFLSLSHLMTLTFTQCL